jgi:regulator of protease activity HflC (stomatin/prohibitin superfamily)
MKVRHLLGILACLIFFPGCIGPCEVWLAQYAGKAKLAEAESSRRIQIEDAKGKLDAAKMLADAEIARARGVAEANQIIGNSLRENEAYLKYLWIQNMNNEKEVIYVPTEAGLPILESGKRK